LWIIPVALISSRIFRSGTTTIRLPYFIGLFILAILVNTYVPFIGQINTQLVTVSKAGLTVTLFLIGSGLSKQVLGSVGLKPV
ncbi:putative sulfate exporter family transporter, partial [Salmonella enterica]|uniref:putative sulfate exporter family transporter n=1 Tax=Salmonella enterica TaxID=28901 RepID=UPI0020A5B156